MDNVDPEMASELFALMGEQVGAATQEELEGVLRTLRQSMAPTPAGVRKSRKRRAVDPQVERALAALGTTTDALQGEVAAREKRVRLDNLVLERATTKAQRLDVRQRLQMRLRGVPDAAEVAADFWRELAQAHADLGEKDEAESALEAAAMKEQGWPNKPVCDSDSESEGWDDPCDGCGFMSSFMRIAGLQAGGCPPRTRAPPVQQRNVAPHVKDGETFTFGKHRGSTFWEVTQQNPSYSQWAEKQKYLAGQLADFVQYSKEKREAGKKPGA